MTGHNSDTSYQQFQVLTSTALHGNASFCMARTPWRTPAWLRHGSSDVAFIEPVRVRPHKVLGSGTESPQSCPDLDFTIRVRSFGRSFILRITLLPASVP